MENIQMRLVDWLDDLCVRFIINLPQEELASVERICFQIEEAQWFYEDFIRPLDPKLPSLNLRKFCTLVFQHCPLLAHFSEYHSAAYSEFLAYKTRVPVRGAIMLNEDMDQVVLVKGWRKGARWSFPRGKINQHEKDLDCAVREAYEETGFDIATAGLVQEESEMKYIEMTLRDQHMRLYVFRGVPMDTHFEPRTRKEISKIQWYRLSDLPTLRKGQQTTDGVDTLKGTMFYMVAPFLGQLKRWIKQQRKKDDRGTHHVNLRPDPNFTDADNEEDATADEDAVALEEDVISPQDAHEQSHMDRLLQSLRNSRLQQENSDLPEVSSGPDVDPAAQLKRMLSVGSGQQPLSHIQQPRPQPANPLLAMFKSGTVQSAIPQSNPSIPPSTPLEQINATPTEAQTPHHHHPRHPPFSSMPPAPAFPLSPAHLAGEQVNHPFAHQLPRHLPMGQPGMAGPPSQSPFHSSHMPPPPLPQRYGPPMTAMPPHPHALPRPNALPPHQLPAFSNLHSPAIPPASKLPPPKLTSQKMALLDAFKKPPLPDNIPPTHQEPDPAAYRAQPMHPITTSIPKQPYSESSPSVAAVHAQFLPPQIGPMRPRQKVASNGNQQPAVATPKGPQQKALLDLFRSPSASSNAPEHEAATSRKNKPSLAPEPVELSAQPSPGFKGRNPFHTTGQPQPADSLLETAVKRSRAISPRLTSATVHGPLNAPNFSTAVSQQQKLSAVELGDSVPASDAAAAVAGQHLQHSTDMRGDVGLDLLQDLHNAFPRNSHSPLPQQLPMLVRVPAQGQTHVPLNIQAPKPFHPQHILQQQRMAGSGSGTNLHTQVHSQAFDRSGSVSDRERSALLGLFKPTSNIAANTGAIAAPANRNTSAGVSPANNEALRSPVSPLPSHRSPAPGVLPKANVGGGVQAPFRPSARSASGSGGEAGGFVSNDQRSRMSSLVSSIGGDASHHASISGLSGTAGGVGMVVTANGTAKSSSPTTPVADRNFLLGYLESVVMGNQK